MPGLETRRIAEKAAPQALIRIVDDDAVLRESLAFMLDAAGWRTKTYASAMDFLRQDAVSVPGCVILDVRMPGMSGLEMQLELNRRAARIPIIFLTAHGVMDMAVFAMKKGAVDFLSKPVDPERLIEAVRGALARQQLRDAGMQTPAEVVARYEGLTSREKEVCAELVRGRTNHETGKALHISERTVEGHRASAFRKLSVRTVRELADFYDALEAIHNERAPEADQ